MGFISAKQGTRNQVYAYYRYEAKRRGRVWELTKEEFFALATKPCFYCQKPPSNKCQPKKCPAENAFWYSGLDRTDNNIGYVATNVVPCCSECNGIKGDRLSSAEMLEVAKVLVSLRNKKPQP